MTDQPRPARRTRSRRSIAAALIALPLIAAPVAVPSVAAAATIDARSFYGSFYGSYGGNGYGAFDYGSLGGFGDPFQGGLGAQSATQTTQDATTASTAQSSGVVLIDTVVDYDEGEAAGTGLVLTSDGTVVTNHHVVAGATSITVTVPSTGKKYDATVVGYSTSRDVAVLKLTDASGLSTVSTDPTVSSGEAVTAVGNAEGAGELTAAAGEVLRRRTTIDVSGDDGTSEHLTNLIETDADVVSGDSGGALLDGDNEVVGMNVAASTGTSQVTGYAIPISRVLRIEAKILAGTASSTITIGSRAALGVQVATGSTTPTVAGVVSGGAADKAGIGAGDTITSVGGTSVATFDALSKALTAYRPGDQVRVGWTDTDGTARSTTVTLGTAPIG